MLPSTSASLLRAGRISSSALPACCRQLPLRPRWALCLPKIHQRCVGTEPSKISEDDQLDLARRRKDEGAIMAVQSGLFKLLLPLPNISETSIAKRIAAGDRGKDDNAVLFLLHPRQPISMISSLIQAEITRKDEAPIAVSFHGAQESISQARTDSALSTPQWAQSTELGDFVQEAAQDSKFVIALHKQGQTPHVLPVRVPTFEQRTMHLRDRLKQITGEMQSLLEIKTKCDDLALKGAKRAATAGFGGLVAYWGIVYYLTFHVYSWDLMEPVTYLTGLTGVLGGYFWFLYHQKEISYRSVFEMSSAKRREQFYDQYGFDRQAFDDLVNEGSELRRAIKKIAADYSTSWSMDKELNDDRAVKEIKKNLRKKTGKSSDAETADEADQDSTKPSRKKP